MNTAAEGTNRFAAATLVFLATFTDILAYSIAVPVLPDLSARLGASPTVIGLLFGSFGVTLLGFSIPMGAVSDRIGRRLPMLIGLAALSASSILFAFSTRLSWLFAARLTQGAADAITWVVGLALVADLYGPHERGRVAGFVMSGAAIAFMLGPTIGGWLYEAGGIRLPFLIVGVLAAACLVGFAVLPLPAAQPKATGPSVRDAIRQPAIFICIAVVVAASGTIAMLEPVVVLQLQALGVTPGRVGLVFGVAAVINATCNPVFGRLADRFGATRLMLIGLAIAAVALPIVGRATSLTSAMLAYALEAVGISMIVTTSLSFIAEASSRIGRDSFGLAYGLYNVGWGIGLLAGPAIGGFLFERIGFQRLTFWWAPLLVIAAILLARLPATETVEPRS